MGRDIAKIEALQRLDLEDLNNIQNFVTEYLNAALGGLFGYTRGLLTPPKVTRNSDNNILNFQLTAFQVAISSAGDSGDYPANGSNVKSDVKLEVVRFDPSDEGHLYYSSAGSSEAINNGYIRFGLIPVGSFLCVSADDVDQDSANRVFWNIASGAETTSATTTTTRRRLNFRWRTTVDDIEDNEAPILTLVNNATGECRLISAWDDYRTWEALNESTGNWHDYTSLIGVSGLLSENIGPNPSDPLEFSEGVTGPLRPQELNVTRDLGLNMLLAYTRAKLRRMTSDGVIDDPDVTPGKWHSRPTLSLAGLKYAFDNGYKRRYAAIIEVVKNANGTTTINVEDYYRLSNATITVEDTDIHAADNNPATVEHTHVLTFTLDKDPDDENIRYVDGDINFLPLASTFEVGNVATLNLQTGITFVPINYVDQATTIFNASDTFQFAVSFHKDIFHEFFHNNNTWTGSFKFMVTISGTPAP